MNVEYRDPDMVYIVLSEEAKGAGATLGVFHDKARAIDAAEGQMESGAGKVIIEVWDACYGSFQYNLYPTKKTVYTWA